MIIKFSLNNILILHYFECIIYITHATPINTGYKDINLNKIINKYLNWNKKLIQLKK